MPWRPCFSSMCKLLDSIHGYQQLKLLSQNPYHTSKRTKIKLFLWKVWVENWTVINLSSPGPGKGHAIKIFRVN